MEKLGGILKAQQSCEKLEYLINFNMRTVDEVIIPSLKDLLLKVGDLKSEISELQSIQVSLLGEEDSLMNSLNELQEAFRGRIREIYENEVTAALLPSLSPSCFADRRPEEARGRDRLRPGQARRNPHRGRQELPGLCRERGAGLQELRPRGSLARFASFQGTRSSTRSSPDTRRACKAWRPDSSPCRCSGRSSRRSRPSMR